LVRETKVHRQKWMGSHGQIGPLDPPLSLMLTSMDKECLNKQLQDTYGLLGITKPINGYAHATPHRTALQCGRNKPSPIKPLA